MTSNLTVRSLCVFWPKDRPSQIFSVCHQARPKCMWSLLREAPCTRPSNTTNQCTYLHNWICLILLANHLCCISVYQVKWQIDNLLAHILLVQLYVWHVTDVLWYVVKLLKLATTAHTNFSWTPTGFWILMHFFIYNKNCCAPFMLLILLECSFPLLVFYYNLLYFIYFAIVCLLMTSEAA